MKQLLIFTLCILIAIQTYGQDCVLVSGGKDKITGIETKGGVISSKDFFSLLIQKQLNSNDSMNYFLLLNAASKVMLPDSILNSKGNFELFLTNGQKVVIENAECQNNPIGLGASIGFTVTTTKSIIEQIINNPIQKIRVFKILETEFSPRNQKEQQKILNCLKKEK